MARQHVSTFRVEINGGAIIYGLTLDGAIATVDALYNAFSTMPEYRDSELTAMSDCGHTAYRLYVGRPEWNGKPAPAPAPAYVYVKLRAPLDRNGNPQRLYIVKTLNADDARSPYMQTVAVIDEDGYGDSAVLNRYPGAVPFGEYEIDVQEYRRFKRAAQSSGLYSGAYHS